MSYSLTRKARQDLLEIYVTGVRDFGVAQAERYQDSLEATFVFLAEWPFAARERTEIEPPVRVHPHKSHLVVYVTRGRDVLIIRVPHGHADWDDPLTAPEENSP